MIIKLPILADSYDQQFNIQLSSKTYTFRVRYNQTEDAWYCYIGLIAEDPKIKIKLVTGIELLAPWRAYEEVPEGYMYVYDKDLIYGRPGKDNFNQDARFILVMIV